MEYPTYIVQWSSICFLKLKADDAKDFLQIIFSFFLDLFKPAIMQSVQTFDSLYGFTVGQSDGFLDQGDQIWQFTELWATFKGFGNN